MATKASDKKKPKKLGRWEKHKLYRQLVDAIGKGKLNVVEKLLAKGASLEVPYSGTEPLIVIAAMAGQVESIRFLLAHGAKVDDRHGQYTPLKAAAKEGHLEAVKALVAAGADMKNGGEDGTWSPQYYAAAAGKLKVVRYFIELGVTAFGSALNSACYQGHRQIVEELVRLGIKSEPGKRNGLHAAASGNHPEIIQFLLDQGYDINAVVKGDGTPLMEAVLSRSKEAALLLIQKGADLRPRNNIGHTALHYAVIRSQLEVAKALLEAGANPSQANSEGDTPLSLARASKQKALVQLLETVQKRAVKKFGPSDLLAAARRGDATEIQSCLKASVPVDSIEPQDPLGETALLAASAYGHEKVVDILIKAGAKLEARDTKGRTPLVVCEKVAVARLLVAAGAKIDARDLSGKSALDYADESSVLRSFLVKSGAKPAPKPKRVRVTLAKALGISPQAARTGMTDWMEMINSTHPEFSLCAVKGEFETVLPLVQALLKPKKIHQDVPLRGAPKQSGVTVSDHSVLAQAQAGWCVFYHSFFNYGAKDLENIRALGRELSKQLKTVALTMAAEDTSSVTGYDLYRDGECLEEANWGGDDSFQSQIRPNHAFNGEADAEEVLQTLGLYLPACFPPETNESPYLSIEKNSKSTIQRAALLELK